MKKMHIKSNGIRHHFEGTDGQKLIGVSEVKINLSPDDVSVALVTISMVEIDIEAHPLLSVKSLQEAAKYHGFKLVPDEGAI